MPASGNVLCVRCERIMRPKRNGVIIEELMDDGRPYQKWEADALECPACGFEVVAGFGRTPLVEHWQDSYEALGGSVYARAR